ncbi:xylulokinase [Lachnospiraceae bacterium 42-17]
MGYLLGIDLGTSSLKSILITEDGEVKGLSAKAYQFASPYNGYAEHDPEEWWQACCETIHEVLARAKVPGDEIKGLSFSGQMHGAVMLDEDFRPVRPAILHCDARSGKQVLELKSSLGAERIKEVVMNPIYTGFLLPSLLWVKETEAENFRRIAHVMLPKDYLKFKMTGEVSTDYSDASATLAFDIRKNEWSSEILACAGVPREWFPVCLDTAAAAGTVCRRAAEETGLSVKTIVAPGGGDQVMQGIGNGITRAGEACSNIGTSGQVSFQSDIPVQNPALNTNTFCGYKKGRWFTMGAIMNAGLSYKWFSSLFDKVDYDAMNERIGKVPPGSGGVIFLPYLNGERTPHLNPNISGGFMGLNVNTGRSEMARAVMEGVAFALNECIEVCKELGLSADVMTASGGAAKSMPWLQIQADVFGCSLKVADTQEQASMGAAIAAGTAAGIYRDIEEGCAQVVRYKDFMIEPVMENHKIYQEYYELYKEMYRESSSVIERLTLVGRRKPYKDK